MSYYTYISPPEENSQSSSSARAMNKLPQHATLNPFRLTANYCHLRRRRQSFIIVLLVRGTQPAFYTPLVIKLGR